MNREVVESEIEALSMTLIDKELSVKYNNTTNNYELQLIVIPQKEDKRPI